MNDITQQNPSDTDTASVLAAAHEAADEVVNKIGPFTLAYATPAGANKLEIDPEAEAEIDAGAGPNALRRRFGSPQRAAEYFARSVARRESVDALDRRCCQCGAETSEFVFAYWNVIATITRAGASTSVVPIFTQTAHALCRPCAARWRLPAERLARAVRRLTWLGLGAWGVLITLFISSAALHRRKADGHWMALVALALFVVPGGVALVRKVLLGRFAALAPEPIRTLMPASVRYIGFSDLLNIDAVASGAAT